MLALALLGSRLAASSLSLRVWNNTAMAGSPYESRDLESMTFDVAANDSPLSLQVVGTMMAFSPPNDSHGRYQTLMRWRVSLAPVCDQHECLMPADSHGCDRNRIDLNPVYTGVAVEQAGLIAWSRYCQITAIVSTARSAARSLRHCTWTITSSASGVQTLITWPLQAKAEALDAGCACPVE